VSCGTAQGQVRADVKTASQGLCGSVMIPLGLPLMKVVFPPQHPRKALIPVGPLMGLAGPRLGWHPGSAGPGTSGVTL
jgi:hypothetical protein